MMISIWFSGFLKKDDLWFGLISSLLLFLLPIIVLLNPDNQNILFHIYIYMFFGKDKSKLTRNDQPQDTLMREKVYLEAFSHILRLALRLGHVTPWKIIDLRSYQLENCKFAQLPIVKQCICANTTSEIIHLESYLLENCIFRQLPTWDFLHLEVTAWEIVNYLSYCLGKYKFWKLHLGNCTCWKLTLRKFYSWKLPLRKVYILEVNT